MDRIRLHDVQDAVARYNAAFGFTSLDIGYLDYADIRGDGQNRRQFYVVVNDHGGLSNAERIKGRTLREKLAAVEAITPAKYRKPAGEPLPIVFRAERAGPFKGQVTAVFPTVPYGGFPAVPFRWDYTIYAHEGQHGAGSRYWYQSTRAARPAEYRTLLAELRQIYEQGADPVPLRVFGRIPSHRRKS